MNPRKIYLSKYIFDGLTIQPLPTDETHREYQTWANISSLINDIAGIQPDEQNASEDYNDFAESKGLSSEVNRVILLLLKSKSLANSSANVFNALLNSDLRPHVPPKERKRPSEIRYHPILTLCYTDITSLHTEEKDDRGGLEERHWNGLTYDTFDFDSRVKFLDSSIWHRFIPFINPYKNDTFRDRFTDILQEVKEYYEKGLYYSIAANVTLEFHMRMLHNSYIAKIGRRGHSEAVTPFKFHSESQMQRKVKAEKGFLCKKWPGGLQLAKALKWRILVVDDQADSEISSLSKDLKCTATKRTLLEQPFRNLYQTNDDFDSRPGKDNNIEIYGPEGDVGIIKWAISQMKERTFDIVLLDYLLGYEDEEGTEREYGFEFLLQLLQDNNKDLPEIRRDFLGKYWIFPISAFPHALVDKLTQMGIGHLHEIWHLSQGGDPVSTPHLYAYNLHRFMKQRIREFFLYPRALKSFFHQIIIGGENGHTSSNGMQKPVWPTLLVQAIEDDQKRFTLLRDFSSKTYGKDSSPFVFSMIQFLRKQHDEYFEDIFSLVVKISNLVKNVDAFDIYNKIKNLMCELDALLMTIKKEHQDADFINSLDLFKTKVFHVIDFPANQARKVIAAAIEDRRTSLTLTNQRLTYLPTEISKVKNMHIIDLSNNNLSRLPEECINLDSLEEIDLSNNKFTEFPKVLLKLENLEKIILDNNELFELPTVEIRQLRRLKALSIKNNRIDVATTEASNKSQLDEMLQEVETHSKNERKVDFIRLIINGKFDTIFQKIEDIELDKEDRNEITLLEGQYKQLISNSSQLSMEQNNLQLSKIRKSLLIFTQKIPKQ